MLAVLPPSRPLRMMIYVGMFHRVAKMGGYVWLESLRLTAMPLISFRKVGSGPVDKLENGYDGHFSLTSKGF